MKPFYAVALSLAAVSLAQADFSYTMTRKSTGGMMAQMANNVPATTQTYLKGQKIKLDLGASATIIDFDAQTITQINSAVKTYTVTPFSELSKSPQAAGANITADVKETGQKRNINGYNAGEMLLTVEMEMPQARQIGGKMQMEMNMWISPDVPGSDQLRAFYERNRANFPWSALAGTGANNGMQQAMAEIQKKMASMNGVPVEQVIRLKAPGMSAQTGAQMQGAQAGMAQARAKLEQLAAQGGPAAAFAKEQLAKMGGGTPGGSAGGALIEMTMDSTDFSTAPIPDSIFSIPAGFTQAAK